MSKNKKKDNNEVKNNQKKNISGFDKILFNPLVITLLICAAGYILYNQTLTHGFTYFDDHYIFPNAAQLKGLNTANEIFKRDAILSTSGIEFYRPIQGLSFLIDASIGFSKEKAWDRPYGYHLSNLIIHILTCLALFWFLSTLKLNKYLSLLFTLAFCVNPVFVQSVAWIPARGDLLIGLFGILTFTFFIKYFENRNIIYLILHLVTFFISVFSKETTILFPIAFAMYYWFFVRPKSESKIFSPINISIISLWAGISVLYIYLRSVVTNPTVSTSNLSFSTFITHLLTIPEMIAKIIVPVSLSGMPEYNLFNSTLGILFVLSFIFLIYKFRDRINPMGYIGLVWFLLFTTITMIYRHPHGNGAYAYLEHRIYLPAVGILIFLLSFPLSKIAVRNISILVLIMIVGFSVLANNRIKYYNNPESFYGYVIDSGTKVALAYNNRGYYRELTGKFQLAYDDFNMAAKIKPDYALAISNRGNQKNRTGDKKGAMDDYNLALKIDSNLAEAYNNRGYMYYSAKDYRSAASDFEKAISIKKEFTVSIVNLGIAKFYMNDLAGACTEWYKAAQLGHVQAKEFMKKYCNQSK